MSLVIGILVSLFSGHILWKVVRHKHEIKRWIYIEIIYNLFIKYLIGYMNFPSVLNYVSDAILIIIIFYFLYHNAMVHDDAHKYIIPREVSLFFVSYILICFISWMINLHSTFLFLWGIRNNARFIIFFAISASCLDIDDYNEILDVLYKYLICNLFVVIFQCTLFSSGHGKAYGDYVSGLFSNGESSRGGNSSLDWLMCIVSSASIIQYLNKENSIFHMTIAVGSSLVIATLNETKMYPLQLIIITVVALIIVKKSLKTVVLVSVILVGVFISIQVIYYLFPRFQGFFTIENIIEYGSNTKGYTRGDAINRFNSITYVFDRFLKEPIERFIGIGLGNADSSSSFSFLTSQFYINNSWTAYQWFSLPMILIETGIVGLSWYIALFMRCFYLSFFSTPEDSSNKSLRQLSVLMIVLVFIALVCNQSLRMETMGFTVWLFLGIPYVLGRRVGG